MRALLIFIAFAVLASCKSKNTGGGEHLSPKVMQLVMLDVNLAEAYSVVVKDSLHKGGTKNYDSLAVYYKTVFNHYKITPEQFTESLNWYKANPEKLDTLYTALLNKITPMQAASPHLSPAMPQPRPPMPSTFQQRTRRAPAAK